MFRVSALPRITFLGSDFEQDLDCSLYGLQIQQLADAVCSLTPPGGRVGLIFQTCPNLVLAWLGVVAAGRVPLILQYPNEKISRNYWKESVSDTVRRCQLNVLLCASELSGLAPQEYVPCFFLGGELDPPEGTTSSLTFPDTGHILQLSSGTTGIKKAIRFDFEALRKHASLYSKSLDLTAGDRIVSWLPLYHDMGFIACFVMPLMLGIPIVMIDPMAWVRQPSLLFDAIQRFQGTVCYMPNFGFEVMAKLGKSGPFPSMRHWISCSEPAHAATLERFLKGTGTSPKTLSTCYAMAENVFAVSQSAGMRIFERDGQQHVSCGRPIPETEVKEVAGEIFVRSPHSLESYDGGEDIRDREGFYPTGDVGFIEDGELVVTGRKQDLANIGGRKYLLNDWDFALGKLFPLSAGRIASLALFDSATGTEKALFLIEATNFWEWERSPAPAQMIREATGVEWMEVHFVPPQFITKTSSGKINRGRTLQDWLACKTAAGMQGNQAGEPDIARQLAECFPSLPGDCPVHEKLDSLGELMLRIFCEEHGVEFAPDLTLDHIVELSKTAAPETQAEVFSIIALVDGWRLGFEAPKPHIDESFLQAIAKVVGCPVHFEHICVPPASILFSDLTFHDYFLPRVPDSAYGPVASLLRKIKKASLILIDDEDNFRTPPFCAYPALDHQFAMGPDADLLGHRLQRYTQNHHLLPRRVVLGRELRPENVNPTIKNLEEYLGVPIFKIAFHSAFRAYTEQWDFRDYREFASDADKVRRPDWLGRFRDVLLKFLRRREKECPRRRGESKNRFVFLDSPHFCSFLLNRRAVDFVTRVYGSFCITGLPSSLPYLQERLDQLGKSYFFSMQTNPTRDDYECLILTGGVEGKMPSTGKPTFDFVHAREQGQGGGRPHNVPPEIAQTCPPLAACNEELFRSVSAKNGVLIGNFLLNNTTEAPRPAPSAHPLLDQFQQSMTEVWKNDFGQLARYREANSEAGLPAPDEQRVIFFGDSITDGWNLDRYFPGKGYINRGIGGQSTSQMLLRFRQDVLDLRPQAVVILAGANDVGGNTGPIPLDDIVRNYATLSELARAHNIEPIFSSITPVNGIVPEILETHPLNKIRALNDWLKEYCAYAGHPFVDYFESMADDRGLLRPRLSADGIHPNDEGYRIMAPLAARAIEQILSPSVEDASLA